MKTYIANRDYSILAAKSDPDIKPQAIPPDKAPAPPEYRPEQEENLVSPVIPEIYPKPNHPVSDPAES